MSGTQISRRGFLKLMGASATVVVFGSLAGFLSQNNKVKTASAQTTGSWQVGPDTHTTAIHAALLSNGKILYVTGSGYYNSTASGPFSAGIVDPETNSVSPLSNQSSDLFCCCHAQLANGNIVLAGGTLTYNTLSPNGQWLGLKDTYLYDVSSNSISKIQSMAHGRWYPTLVTLANGKVLCVGGYDEYGVQNRLCEIFDPSSNSWSIQQDPNSTVNYCVGEGEDPALMPGAGSPCYSKVAPNVLLYPRMHLMPTGLVAVCGQSKTLRTFDPSTGIWKFAGNMNFGASRGYGSSVLLPLQNTTAEKGKVLVFGGTATADSTATTHAEILTISGTSLSSRQIASSKKGRKHPIPVILPTGKVFVVGGAAFQNDQSTKIMEPEIFDPDTESWTLLSAMPIGRTYHSSGLLLPDGRVWTGGSTPSLTTRTLTTSYFSPDYVSSADRPTISGTPTVGDYGASITIPTSDASAIQSVSLVRLGTETHAFNSDQRFLWLQIQSASSSAVTVAAPINSNLAPPGYYMIHVLKNGVPSKAKIIKIPGTGTSPGDTVPPTVSITSPEDGDTVSGPSGAVVVNVAGAASDSDSGISKVEIKIGSNPFKDAVPVAANDWSSWTGSDTVATEGTHAIIAKATDGAGNTQQTEISVTAAFASGGGTFTPVYSVAATNSYGTLSTGTTNVVRVGEKLTSASSLIGNSVKRVTVIVKKAGNPTGPITVVVRKGSDDSVALTFGTIDPASITTSDQNFTLTAPSSHTFAANDKVLVEWAGSGSDIDKVMVKRKGDVDGFDGANTYFVAHNGSSYANSSVRDLAGTWEKQT